MSLSTKKSPVGTQYCHLCGTRLLGRYYLYETGVVCCEACQRGRPRCARCGVPLDDASIARQQASPSGTPALCVRCVREAPQCAACGHPITGSYYTFDELGAEPPRRFCERCVHNRPRCDLCRAPVAAGLRPLADGQYRCAICARDLVLDAAEVQQIYQDALAALQQIVRERLRQVPRLVVTSRRELAKVRRRYASQGVSDDGIGHHVLGFFVRSGSDAAVYVERALPRGLLLGTLAHELGHAWQAESAPWVRDPMLSEGFAEWVAHHVLVARGRQSEAARATRRDDLYGRALRTMLDIEQARGLAGVLAAARGRQ